MRLGTLLTAALGGLYIVSLLCIVVATPPFNHRLGWMLSLGAGEFSIGFGFQRMGAGAWDWRPHAADSIALLPHYRNAGRFAFFGLPLWGPLLLVAAPTVVLDRLERRGARSRAEACPDCGYPAHGLPSFAQGWTCPECGRSARRIAA